MTAQQLASARAKALLTAATAGELFKCTRPDMWSTGLVWSVCLTHQQAGTKTPDLNNRRHIGRFEGRVGRKFAAYEDTHKGTKHVERIKRIVCEGMRKKSAVRRVSSPHPSPRLQLECQWPVTDHIRPNLDSSQLLL